MCATYIVYVLATMSTAFRRYGLSLNDDTRKSLSKDLQMTPHPAAPAFRGEVGLKVAN